MPSILKYHPRELPRRILEYARLRIYRRLAFGKGGAGDVGLNIARMLANKQFYTSGTVPFPHSAVIETTARCNLACIMCGRLDDPRKMGDLSDEAFKACQEGLIPHLKRVDLSGHGETFLSKHLMDLFRQAKEHGAHVGIVTNATLIDDDAAETLVRRGMDEIMISIDAASAELFERIRKGAKLEKVLANIDRINRFKEQYKRNTPRLTVQMVAMKMNIHELPRLVELAADRVKACSVSVVALREYSSVRGQSLEPSPELSENIIPKARAIAGEKGIQLNLSPVVEALLAPDKGKKGADAETLAAPSHTTGEIYMNCEDPWKFTFISYTGQVKPCCAMERVMGDLTKQTFAEIWHGEEYVKLRTRALSGSPPEACLKCIFRTRYYRKK